MARKQSTGKGKKEKQTKAASHSSSAEGRFSYTGLDRVMHEKARLGILASLAANAEGLLFNDLKQLCALTDGNLSRHLTVLAEADLVEVWKETTTSRPQTLYRLTPTGRQRFAEYISVLEKVVSDAQIDAKAVKGLKDLPGGWAPA